MRCAPTGKLVPSGSDRGCGCIRRSRVTRADPRWSLPGPRHGGGTAGRGGIEPEAAVAGIALLDRDREGHVVTGVCGRASDDVLAGTDTLGCCPGLRPCQAVPLRDEDTGWERRCLWPGCRSGGLVLGDEDDGRSKQRPYRTTGRGWAHAMHRYGWVMEDIASSIAPPVRLRFYRYGAFGLT